jgi:ABC-type spermidine/putrescine transport system permease subunit I
MENSNPLEVLLQIFTPAQLEQIIACARIVVIAGFGEVTITIQSGHPRFIQSTISEEMVAPEQNKNKGVIEPYNIYRPVDRRR